MQDQADGMKDSHDGHDLAWPWKRILVTMIVPFKNSVKSVRLTHLEALRFVFVGVFSALLTLLLVLALGQPWSASQPLPPLVWAVLAAGAVIGLAGGAWARRQTLPCGEPDELVAAYRRRLFIGLGFGYAPMGLGFVAALLTNAASVYLVGLAFAAISLLMVAPTAGDLGRKQAELQAQGWVGSLAEALTASTPKT